MFSSLGPTMSGTHTYQFSQSTMLTIRGFCSISFGFSFFDRSVAVSSVLQLIGILLSLFRLWFRLKIRRLWWEDAWAFIACLCSIVLLASEWMYLKGGTYQTLSLSSTLTLQPDWTVSIVGFWMYTLALTCVVWYVT